MNRFIFAAVVLLAFAGTALAQDEPSNPDEYPIQVSGRGYTGGDHPNRDVTFYFTGFHRKPLLANTSGLRVELIDDARDVLSFAGGYCWFHFRQDDDTDTSRSYSLAIQGDEDFESSGFVQLNGFDDFEHLIQIDIVCRVTDSTIDLGSWKADSPYGIRLTGSCWDLKAWYVARRQSAEADLRILRAQTSPKLEDNP